jgi:hypothetical protein
MGEMEDRTPEVTGYLLSFVRYMDKTQEVLEYPLSSVRYMDKTRQVTRYPLSFVRFARDFRGAKGECRPQVRPAEMLQPALGEAAHVGEHLDAVAGQ